MKEKIKKVILKVLEENQEGIKRFDLWNEAYRKAVLEVEYNFREVRIINEIFKDFKKNDSSLRSLVRELKEEGYPIGSSVDRGYFIIRTQEDFDEAIKTYKSKIMGMFDMIKKIKKAVEEKNKVQLELSLNIS